MATLGLMSSGGFDGREQDARADVGLPVLLPLLKPTGAGHSHPLAAGELVGGARQLAPGFQVMPHRLVGAGELFGQAGLPEGRLLGFSEDGAREPADDGQRLIRACREDGFDLGRVDASDQAELAQVGDDQLVGWLLRDAERDLAFAGVELDLTDAVGGDRADGPVG